MAEEKRASEPVTGTLLPKRPRMADAAHLRAATFVHSPEWQAVLRITASRGFAKSALLANFLRYVCERKLQGRDGEITEQQIGTHAFGRSATYNPGDDNIVRNYARILRQRLDDFYAEEGHNEPLRIVIARGSYVPHFERQHATETQTPHASVPRLAEVLPSLPAPSPREPVQQSTANQRFWSARILNMAASSAVLLFLLGTVYAGRKAWFTLHPDVYTDFWNQVLPPHRSNIVVLADSGIGILQDFTGTRIRLHEYASGDMSGIAAAFARRVPQASFGVDRFKNLTSTADVHTLLDLVPLPQFTAANPRIRHAQDVRMDDLAGSNAIIVGGPRANPWVELYEPVSDFRLDIPDEFHGAQLDARIVINKKPHTGEAASFSNGFHADEGYVNHSILSFLPSLDGHGHVLLFQGGNMGATQATADFATDRLSMEPILKRARGPDGTLRPFEVLLETRVVGASSPKAEVLLVHYKWTKDHSKE